MCEVIKVDMMGNDFQTFLSVAESYIILIFQPFEPFMLE